MDDKLKEAIETVRAGDKQAAQRQLTTLLQDNPEEAQGWYLLSLLVDSPRKQAAYLSKTLALNPHHSKAKEQLATLGEDGQIAPTSTIREATSDPINVLTQAESDALPDWLQDEGMQVQATAYEEMTDTAVPNESLPDWLKESAARAKDDEFSLVEDEPTAIAQPDESAKELDKAVAAPQQKTIKKRPNKQAKPGTRKSASSLNIILSVLVLLAFVVMVLLAYLIFT